MEEQEILNIMEEKAKNNELEIIEPKIIWGKKAPIDTSEVEHYKLLTKCILDETTLTNDYVIYSGSSVFTLLILSPTYTYISNSKIQGTYKAGCLNNMPIYVSPYIDHADLYLIDKDLNIVKIRVVD